MMYVGMVFQSNEAEDKILVMFAGGEQRAFSRNALSDGEGFPAVGSKVSCEKGCIEVKVVSVDTAVTEAPGEMEPTEVSGSNGDSQMKSVDEYIEEFTEMGFKLVKDNQVGLTRSLSFRKLEMGDPIEIIVESRGTEVSLKKTVNGKVAEI